MDFSLCAAASLSFLDSSDVIRKQTLWFPAFFLDISFSLKINVYYNIIVLQSRGLIWLRKKKLQIRKSNPVMLA